ncbi:N-acetylmuramoyl-L-alanine amidase [Iningainema tapete]|nr:peptidoglycan recognition family protein [Iningainema tapete]
MIFPLFFSLTVGLLFVGSQLQQKKAVKPHLDTNVWSQYPSYQLGLTKTKKPQSKKQTTPTYSLTNTDAFRKYKPPYKIVWAHPSNYGERFTKDVYGVPVRNSPIIVLHETDAPVSSVLNFFKNAHTDENIQASYHTLIQLDGTVVYLVPPEKRAFGAANSVFHGSKGPETVKTNPNLPPSVNNFAYHVSLESPPSGYMNGKPTHEGYSEVQYRSLAWLVAQSNVPDNRITTHRAVDRSGQKIDPRSFDFKKFFNLLHSFRKLSISSSKTVE